MGYSPRGHKSWTRLNDSTRTTRKLQLFLIYPKSWEKGRESVPMCSPNRYSEWEVGPLVLPLLRGRA